MPLPTARGDRVAEREQFEGDFLFCADCICVHRISRADRATLYLSSGSALAVDDFERYVLRHRDHRLKRLHRSSDAEIRSHARWDPMCRVAWEVTDGTHDFVVTFGRTDLEAPREYTIEPGCLDLESESVEVDAATLQHVIDEALFPRAAPPSRVRALIDVCRRLIAQSPIDRLEPIDEARDNPAVQLACLPEATISALHAEAERLFSGEIGALLELIDNDLRYYIPVVRVARQYRIQTRD